MCILQIHHCNSFHSEKVTLLFHDSIYFNCAVVIHLLPLVNRYQHSDVKDVYFITSPSSYS